MQQIIEFNECFMPGADGRPLRCIGCGGGSPFVLVPDRCFASPTGKRVEYLRCKHCGCTATGKPIDEERPI